MRGPARLAARACLAAALGVAAPSANAAPVEEHPLPAACHAVAVQDGLLVLGQSGGIVTLDSGDPARPRELGRLRLDATIVGVVLDGARAWLAGGSQGLFRVDLSEPAAPRLVQRFDVDGSVRAVALGRDRLFLAASQEGLGVVDLSLPDRLRMTARIGTRDEVRALALRENLLATAEESAGVRLFEVSRPDVPRELAQVGIEGALDLAFVGEFLVVAAGRRGIVLLDLADPRSPRQAWEVPTPRPASTVAAQGRWALVGCGSAGVQVVDPLASDGPRVLRSLRAPGRHPAGRLAADGSIAFVAADRGGFVVFDLTDLADPRLLHPTSRRMRVEIP